MLRRFRPYRAMRIGLAVAYVFPQYLWLLLRERWRLAVPSPEAWNRVHERAAATIHDLGLHLGGLFIKFCQILGARADVLPAAYVEKLARFHDRVPARPFSELARFADGELGKPASEVFSSIDEEPIAAASLAQVHRATLKTGEQVVIKIQYPEIAKLAPADIKNARRVARLVMLLQKRFDIQSVVREVSKFIELELDFEREARSTRRVADDLADCPDVRVPQVHADVSTKRLLVLEFLDGVQIADVAALERAGHARRDVAGRVARIYAQMLFERGFFHGDPHPGNLLVLEDGRIGLLDFGLAKELPPDFASGVARLLVCAFASDAGGALAAARGLGFEVSGGQPEDLLRLVRAMLGEQAKDTSALDLLGQSSIDKIPEHFGLVVRTLILLNGARHSAGARRGAAPADVDGVRRVAFLSAFGTTSGSASAA